MAAEEIDFEQWWGNFLVDAEGHRDPYASIEVLGRYIRGLSQAKRQAFERCLVDVVLGQRVGASLALGALEQGALPETYVALIPLAGQPAPVSDDLRAGALRALAHSAIPQGLALLERYLLYEPIGRDWSSVPWSLWPQAASLFCRAWSRYFSEKPTEAWRGTAIVQAFLREPRAVRLVHEALRAESPTAWVQLRAALLEAASSASWLTESGRGALLSELAA